VHTILSVVVVAILAFLGTMFDNFFAFAAQLIVTDEKRVRRVSYAQAFGVATLVALAGGIGSLLTPIPLPWVGLLCVAPLALAWHAWRQRHKPPSEVFRRGALTTFAMTLALGGDNLAVWIPLLRANGFFHAFVTVAVFAAMELVFIVAAQRITRRPGLVAWGTRHAPEFLPWLYFGLGVLILIECGSL
jgi:cadmium resistance protein CadD (predicted permease)